MKRLLCILTMVFALATAGQAQAGFFPLNISNLQNFLTTYLPANSFQAVQASDFFIPETGTSQFVPLAFEAGHTNLFGYFDDKNEFVTMFTNQTLGTTGALSVITNDDAVTKSNDPRLQYAFKDVQGSSTVNLPGPNQSGPSSIDPNTVLFYQVDKGTNLLVEMDGVKINVLFNGDSNYIFGFNDAAGDDNHDDFIIGLSITTTPEIEPVPVPAAVWLLGSGLVGLVGLRRRA